MGKRILELDGLRGFAALTVVFAHYFGEAGHGVVWFQVGWLGVNIFFVLSGFLIGAIILDQGHKPSFFKSFYFRRCMRIFPVYFIVFLSVIGLARLTGGHDWSDYPWSAAVYATFLQNAAIVLHPKVINSIWLQPAWTLAVEEQFYLILPVLIISTPKRFLAPLLITLCFAALIFRVLLMDIDVTAAWILLPCRMDLLLAGVLLVLLYRHVDLSRHLLALRIIPLVCMVLLACLSQSGERKLMLTMSGSVSAIGIVSFLLAIFYGAPEGERYRGRVLRWFGNISYCLYLIHQPVSGLLHGLILDERPDVGSVAGVSVTVLSLAVSVGLAALSWYWLEKPILTWAAAKNRKLMNPQQNANSEEIDPLIGDSNDRSPSSQTLSRLGDTFRS